MTAIMEPMPIDQMDPPPLTVTMGAPLSGGSPVITIEVPVIVSQAADGTINFDVPTITLPGSGSDSIPSYCTVIWTLEAGENVTSVSFTGQGMELPAVGHPPLPAGVSILESQGVDGAPNQWKTCFKNRIHGPNEPFAYTISINAAFNPGPSANFSLGPGPFSHDPTIVVTLDPIP